MDSNIVQDPVYITGYEGCCQYRKYSLFYFHQNEMNFLISGCRLFNREWSYYNQISSHPHTHPPKHYETYLPAAVC